MDPPARQRELPGTPSAARLSNFATLYVVVRKFKIKFDYRVSNRAQLR